MYAFIFFMLIAATGTVNIIAFFGGAIFGICSELNRIERARPVRVSAPELPANVVQFRGPR